eukprot:TRINITY_DN24845_c0_g1_i1.p1 TRINITY_DN24845_c0_g1~~TRINITY_DN24845_c0_g1_i1.p1  ORF type:complete len:110 (+),score=19.18 TRINITY_DN24845_c0_g1_i1:353-682(+)
MKIDDATRARNNNFRGRMFLLNLSYLVELAAEAGPQIILQIVNFSLLGGLKGRYNIVSLVLSIISFLFQFNPILMNVLHSNKGLRFALETKNANYYSDEEVLTDRARPE